MAFTTIQNLINKLSHSRRSSACTGYFGLVPQELLDHIISLVDDKATFLNCALVHPTWTSISRYHLPFLTLVVHSPSRAKHLTKLVRSSRQTLSSRITGIVLIGDVPFDDIDMNVKSARARAYSKLLHVLKAKGVMLRSGAVENDPSLVRIFAQYFPTVTQLKVTCPSYQFITSFMRALAGSFPHLAELGIELGLAGLDLPDASLYGLDDLRLQMPCLRTLRVVGWNNHLVRWLGDNVVGMLERLDLESTSMLSTCHLGEANSLIQGNKETLKDLRLTFVKHNVAFDLSGLHRLENLEVMSGMHAPLLALDGWRLPSSRSWSLKRVCLRNVTHLCGRGFGVANDSDAGIVFEGAILRKVLGTRM